MTGTQALKKRIPAPHPRARMTEAHVVWQYKDDPESAQREYQFLGVFSTPDLARQQSARMRDSAWTIQIARARLDPDDVC